MLDLSTAQLGVAAGAVLLGYVVYGLTGFGSSVIAVPLLVHVFPLRFAVPMMLLFDLCAGALLGLRNRKRLNLAELKRLLPILCVGMLGGVLVLARAPERWLLPLLGLFLIVFALWSLLRRGTPAPISVRWAVPAGLVGGAFTALYGTGGPIYTVYLARRIADKVELRATIGVLIFSTALVRLLLFSAEGFYGQQGLLSLALVLMPCALVGFAVGSVLHARIPTARAVQVIWILLIASGASLLLRGFAPG
ncbi:MAG: sulfite exporter TauE/SafE family protein [Pseudomonadota bacterium]|nr:sulfite exporter TauE/SafE family protein [Pseudomonadota bacterium]